MAAWHSEKEMNRLEYSLPHTPEYRREWDFTFSCNSAVRIVMEGKG
jgi:hypothetical protein